MSAQPDNRADYDRDDQQRSEDVLVGHEPGVGRRDRFQDFILRNILRDTMRQLRNRGNGNRTWWRSPAR